jgi:PBP1b-binding outer membrane lipoprotein LpoB
MHKYYIPLAASILILTGCSQGMSLEDETKLAEYSACLDAKTEVYLQTSLPPFQYTSWERALEFCASIKP